MAKKYFYILIINFFYYFLKIIINSLHNSAIAGPKPGMKKEEGEGIEFALIHLTMMLL